MLYIFEEKSVQENFESNSLGRSNISLTSFWIPSRFFSSSPRESALLNTNKHESINSFGDISPTLVFITSLNNFDNNNLFESSLKAFLYSYK